MMIRYERETAQFQGVEVCFDGVPVFSGVQLSLALGSERPTQWQDPILRDGVIGLMVEGLTPGQWFVYAKVADGTGDIPVKECGSFYVV